MNIDKILIENRVIKTGSHFVYTSGMHGDTYIDKQIILKDDKLLKKTLKAMEGLVKNKKIDYFIGPESGGAILAKGVSSLFPESDFLVARKRELGFEIDLPNKIKDSRVIVVEDVINTGGSVKKVITELVRNGAVVIGLITIINRGGINEINGVKIQTLKRINLKTYNARNCPLCKNKIPIDKTLGYGK